MPLAASTVEAVLRLNCFGVSFSCMLLLEGETDTFVKDPLTETHFLSFALWLYALSEVSNHIIYGAFCSGHVPSTRTDREVPQEGRLG